MDPLENQIESNRGRNVILGSVVLGVCGGLVLSFATGIAGQSTGTIILAYLAPLFGAFVAGAAINLRLSTARPSPDSMSILRKARKANLK